jgi:alkanesulfonate monooxygenase SsuD/methylene tetrahydromethanopterin reductase-like flavin-dependent oxidoreductase (luciferase family)
MSRARIGLSVPGQLPPADIPAYARRAESAGFDELWLAEDCGRRSRLPSMINPSGADSLAQRR